jgi:hypothetical protein
MSNGSQRSTKQPKTSEQDANENSARAAAQAKNALRNLTAANHILASVLNKAKLNRLN